MPSTRCAGTALRERVGSPLSRVAPLRAHPRTSSSSRPDRPPGRLAREVRGVTHARPSTAPTNLSQPLTTVGTLVLCTRPPAAPTQWQEPPCSGRGHALRPRRRLGPRSRTDISEASATRAGSCTLARPEPEASAFPTPGGEAVAPLLRRRSARMGGRQADAGSDRPAGPRRPRPTTLRARAHAAPALVQPCPLLIHRGQDPAAPWPWQQPGVPVATQRVPSTVVRRAGTGGCTRTPRLYLTTSLGRCRCALVSHFQGDGCGLGHDFEGSIPPGASVAPRASELLRLKVVPGSSMLHSTACAISQAASCGHSGSTHVSVCAGSPDLTLQRRAAGVAAPRSGSSGRSCGVDCRAPTAGHACPAL